MSEPNNQIVESLRRIARFTNQHLAGGCCENHYQENKERLYAELRKFKDDSFTELMGSKGSGGRFMSEIKRIVYTTGYTGKKPVDLKALVERLNARLIDIRYSPNSRVPHWRQKALSEFIGDAYYCLPNLGNRAYKEKRIEIDNFDAGENWLFWHFKDNPTQPVILLCACEKYEQCHRREVAERLKACGYDVTELNNWKEIPIGLL